VYVFHGFWELLFFKWHFCPSPVQCFTGSALPRFPFSIPAQRIKAGTPALILLRRGMYAAWRRDGFHGIEDARSGWHVVG
jgi:hypothetical protein